MARLTMAEPAESARDAIKAHLEARRADPEFQQRLKARVEADREILKRLAEPAPPACQPDLSAIRWIEDPHHGPSRPRNWRCWLLFWKKCPHWEPEHHG